MLYQLSYASPFHPETTKKPSPSYKPETRDPSRSRARTHSRSAHPTAQKSRLAHRRRRSKPNLNSFPRCRRRMTSHIAAAPITAQPRQIRRAAVPETGCALLCLLAHRGFRNFVVLFISRVTTPDPFRSANVSGFIRAAFVLPSESKGMHNLGASSVPGSPCDGANCSFQQLSGAGRLGRKSLNSSQGA